MAGLHGPTEYARQRRLFAHRAVVERRCFLVIVGALSVPSFCLDPFIGNRVEGLSQVSSKTIGASGLAGRYATALFELADADQMLDRVVEDLGRLDTMIDESDDLSRLVRSPVISRDDQTRAMMAIAEKAGMDDLTRRFVGRVARNRRLFALSDMIAAFLRLVAARRGEVVADVTSAIELTDGEHKSLVATLKTAMGAEVTVSAHVDPMLLGGLIVKVGSRMVDSSLGNKLQQLRLAMKGIG
jgi:F-type H+-transporting ATPase subunit delta